LPQHQAMDAYIAELENNQKKDKKQTNKIQIVLLELQQQN
jgi:hypothetical protein